MTQEETPAEKATSAIPPASSSPPARCPYCWGISTVEKVNNQLIYTVHGQAPCKGSGTEVVSEGILTAGSDLDFFSDKVTLLHPSSEGDLKMEWRAVPGATIHEQGVDWSATYPALYECPTCFAAVPCASLDDHQQWHDLQPPHSGGMP